MEPEKKMLAEVKHISTGIGLWTTGEVFRLASRGLAQGSIRKSRVMLRARAVAAEAWAFYYLRTSTVFVREGEGLFS